MKMTTTSKKSIVDQLATCSVTVPEPGLVEEYLIRHPELPGMVLPACKKMRAAFGDAAELVLGMYQDPEIDDRYLTLWVRQERYDPDILERIASASEELEVEREDADGTFLVTTDFRRPGDAHGI